LEKIKQAREDKSKKYIVYEIQPSSLLGFNEKTPSIPAFLKYKKLYKNNEALIGETWAAKPDEIEELKEKVKQEFPDLDVSKIQPNEFKETPEEVALKYIRHMKRMDEITEKYFPGRPWKSLQVTHNFSMDFAAIAILGKDISLESIRELGGKLAQYLESVYWEINGEKIIAKYRDQEIEHKKTLDEIIESLKKASEIRKSEWNK